MVKVKEALCILSFWFDDFQKKKFAFAWGLDHHSCTYNFCCRMFVQNLNILMKRYIVARNTQIYTVIFMENNIQTDACKYCELLTPRRRLLVLEHIFSHCSQTNSRIPVR